MADKLTRRRFLTDVMFVAGGALAAALLASGFQGRGQTASGERTPMAGQAPLPGTPVAPEMTPTPKTPCPPEPIAPMGGEAVAPPPKYEVAGRVAAPRPKGR